MEDESGLDIFTGALRYPFSNGARLFVGGLVGLLFFILIGIPFMLGYQVRCGRKILEGEDDLPGWEDIDSLFVDGIKAAVITLLYGVVTVIVVYGMLIILMMAGIGLNDNLMLLYLVVVMIATLLVALPLTIISQIALLMYIHTDDLGKALNPVNNLRLFLSKPFEFIKALILDYIANILICIPYFILFILMAMVAPDCGACMIIIVLMLSLGWMIFIQNMTRLFIWVKFFARVVDGNRGSPGEDYEWLNQI